MSKQVLFDQEARNKILEGAEIRYKAVSATMGPKGRNAVIGRVMGPPTVTHDGVTVAKELDLPMSDPAVRQGAEIIKQAASKMNDEVGDGTTTVTVLTYHIMREANRLIAAGHNPMTLAKEIRESAKHIVELIKHKSRPVKGVEGLASVS